MKKQTAVEWLVEQINPDMKTMQGNIIQDLLEQAKAMEKEQIEQAIDACRHNYKHSDNYYNETYKGGEQ